MAPSPRNARPPCHVPCPSSKRSCLTDLFVDPPHHPSTGAGSRDVSTGAPRLNHRSLFCYLLLLFTLCHRHHRHRCRLRGLRSDLELGMGWRVVLGAEAALAAAKRGLAQGPAAAAAARGRLQAARDEVERLAARETALVGKGEDNHVLVLDMADCTTLYCSRWGGGRGVGGILAWEAGWVVAMAWGPRDEVERLAARETAVVG